MREAMFPGALFAALVFAGAMIGYVIARPAPVPGQCQCGIDNGRVWSLFMLPGGDKR